MFFPRPAEDGRSSAGEEENAGLQHSGTGTALALSKDPQARPSAASPGPGVPQDLSSGFGTWEAAARWWDLRLCSPSQLTGC